MNEMVNLAERIGIPSLGSLSIGTFIGAEKIVNSPEWQLCLGCVSMLAGVVAVLWGIIKIYDWHVKRRKK